MPARRQRMDLIAVCLLAFVGFSALAVSARGGSPMAHSTGVLLGCLLSLFAAYGMLIALVVDALRCDDTCYGGEGGDWRDRADAWQWSVQFALAIAGLLAVITATILIAGRKYRSGIATMTVAAICCCTWAAILAPFDNGP